MVVRYFTFLLHTDTAREELVYQAICKMVIAKKFCTNVFYAAMSMITFYSHCLAAQETGIAYTSEFQTDFGKGTKWVNLLRAEFEFPIGKISAWRWLQSVLPKHMRDL